MADSQLPKIKRTKYVVCDYWNADMDHRPYRAIFHNSKDESVSYSDVIEKAVRLAGAKDGDEVEVVVILTGKRPFGNRRMTLTVPHIYTRERKEPK